MKNVLLLAMSKAFTALTLCFVLLSGSVRAENYQMTEFHAATEPVLNSMVEFWGSGENVLNNPFFEDVSRDATISIEPGQITLEGITYYQRGLTLLDVFTAHQHFDSRQVNFDSATFPLSSPVAGPQVREILESQPNLANANVFIKEGSTIDGLFSLLLPVGDELIQIDYVTTSIIKGMVGTATLRILLYKPDGSGYEFSEAELQNDQLEEDDLNTTDEGGYTFTEEDNRRFIEEENEDLLKILGCAAGWRECPYGLDPEAVRTWMQIDDDPAELLSEIVNDRRAAQQEAQE